MSQQIPFSIKAGKPQKLDVSGKFFLLLSATTTVQIRGESGAYNTYSAGRGDYVHGGFKVLELLNDSSDASGILFITDFPPVTVTHRSEDRETIVTSDSYTVPSVAVVTLKGRMTTGGLSYRRREAIILNLDANQDASVNGGYTARINGITVAGGAVWNGPGSIQLPKGGLTPVPIKTSDDLYITQIAANPIIIYINQFWYLEL
jgi:hypothetical protein